MRNGKSKHVSMFPSAESLNAFLKSKIWIKTIWICLDTKCVLPLQVYRRGPADVVLLQPLPVTSRRILLLQKSANINLNTSRVFL